MPVDLSIIDSGKPLTQGQLKQFLRDVVEAVGFLPDAVVAAIAGRDAYDAELKGFAVLVEVDSTNSNQPTLYFKLSNTSADWSAGFTFVVPIAPKVDVPFFVGGRPIGAEIVARIEFTTQVTFPASLTGSRASAAAAATGEAIFSLKKNGVEFATLTFDISATGVFVAALEAIFAVGDVLSVIAPDPRDDTLADISITLSGTRTA